MNHKEIVLHCLKSINSTLTDNSGAVVFNPNIYIVEREMNRFQKFTSLCIDNIRKVVGQMPTTKHRNFYNQHGAFALIKDDSVVINLNSFKIEPKSDRYRQTISEPLGEEINLNFITYHECAHLFEGKHWKKELFKANSNVGNKFIKILEKIYDSNLGMQEKLYNLPLRQWIIEQRKWESSIESRLSKMVYHQVNESWADCFSMIMIYKNFGKDVFEKTIAHVMNYREEQRTFIFLDSVSTEKNEEWLGQRHNTANALLKLKNKVLEEHFPSPENLKWEKIKDIINVNVTESLAFDLYQLYCTDEEVDEYIEKSIAELNNQKNTTGEQLELFEKEKDETTFYDMAISFWTNRDLRCFNLGMDIASDLKSLVEREDFFPTMKLPMESATEKFTLWLEVLNVDKETSIYDFYISSLLQVWAAYKIIDLDTTEATRTLQPGKIKTLIDYMVYQKHLDASVWSFESMKKEMPQISFYDFTAHNPIALDLTETGLELERKTLLDKIKEKVAPIYYFSPENIKIKP